MNHLGCEFRGALYVTDEGFVVLDYVINGFVLCMLMKYLVCGFD